MTSPRQEGVAPRQEEVTSRQGEVAPRQEEVTSRQEEVTSRQEEVAPRQGEVTSRQEEVAPRQGEVTSRQGEVTSRQEEVTSRRGEVTETRFRVEKTQIRMKKTRFRIGKTLSSVPPKPHRHQPSLSAIRKGKSSPVWQAGFTARTFEKLRPTAPPCRFPPTSCSQPPQRVGKLVLRLHSSTTPSLQISMSPCLRVSPFQHPTPSFS